MKRFYTGDKTMTLEEQIKDLETKLNQANTDLAKANEKNQEFAKQVEDSKKALETSTAKINELEEYKLGNTLEKNGIKKENIDFVKAYLEKQKVEMTDENLTKVLQDKKYKIFKNNNIIDSDNISGGDDNSTKPDAKKELSEEDIAKIEIEI